MCGSIFWFDTPSTGKGGGFTRYTLPDPGFHRQYLARPTGFRSQTFARPTVFWRHFYCDRRKICCPTREFHCHLLARPTGLHRHFLARPTGTHRQFLARPTGFHHFFALTLGSPYGACVCVWGGGGVNQKLNRRLYGRHICQVPGLCNSKLRYV